MDFPVDTPYCICKRWLDSKTTVSLENPLFFIKRTIFQFCSEEAWQDIVMTLQKLFPSHHVCTWIRCYSTSNAWVHEQDCQWQNRYLFVTQARDGIDVLLLDHEGCQICSVGRQENDSEEGPHQDHYFTGGAFGVLNGHRIVKDNTPQQPHRFPNGERGTSGIWWHDNTTELSISPHLHNAQHNSIIQAITWPLLKGLKSLLTLTRGH